MKKIAIVILLIYAAISTASTALPVKAGLAERHRVSGWNSSFPGHLQNFEEYINHYQDVINRARTDITDVNRQWVIKGNAPFQLEPATDCQEKRAGKYRRGIVFGHGLTDSVYQIHQLAQYFHQQCFYVMTVLLPGHGSRPGDMLETRWEDWVAATDFVVDQMAAQADDIYMAGYSTGGTLALLKASTDSRVKGVFAFSPAVKISNLSMFAGFIDLLGRLYEPMRWMQIMPDEDYFKYESLPYNAVSQIYQLTEVTRKSIAKNNINVPVFTVASAQDSTIDIEATIELMKKLNHEKNHMLLYSQHQLSEPAPIEVVNSHFPEKHQLSLAHTGLSIPADDPYYGENGAYRNCGHYYGKDNGNYINCKQDREIFVGEKTEENLERGIMRRATYNFLYRDMLTELDSFINNL